MTKRPEGIPNLRPIQGLNSQWYDFAGKPISPDQAIDQEYANRYWHSERGRLPGKRASCVDSIESAVSLGELSVFVSSTGIEEEDKEKLSAYRTLADELGYKVGKYSFNPNAHTVTAPIKRDR